MTYHIIFCLFSMIIFLTASKSPLPDCDAIKQVYPEAQSGIYTIFPFRNNDSLLKLDVFCKFAGNTDDAWMVIQRRFDCSVDFAKTWNTYKEGFGKADGEFWIGNDLLNKLSNVSAMSLQFDLWDYSNSNYSYARYDRFSVGSEEEKFPLLIGNYTGNAGDPLTALNNSKFSTFDQDNSPLPPNCAFKKGGWWYDGCHYGLVNGIYSFPGLPEEECKLFWFTFFNDGTFKRLKKMEVKIKFHEKLLEKGVWSNWLPCSSKCVKYHNSRNRICMKDNSPTYSQQLVLETQQCKSNIVESTAILHHQSAMLYLGYIIFILLN